MDLTGTWCRIETLVDNLAQHIVAIENGTKRDYGRAAKAIKQSTREIEQLTLLATQLSQNVSDRMQPAVREAEFEQAMHQTASHNGVMTSEAPLIDLTAEDAEGEAERQHPEKPSHST